jgi:hypothetical protein
MVQPNGRVDGVAILRPAATSSRAARTKFFDVRTSFAFIVPLSSIAPARPNIQVKSMSSRQEKT